MAIDKDGPIIAYVWYEELKAENARLKAEVVHDLNQIGGLQQENAKLKAEVERLRKAGDAMACHLVCSDLPNDVCGDLMKNWTAAKKGKPSV